MKNSKVKLFFISILIFMFSISVIYGITTTLNSPADNFVDDDGFLDLRATCTPTSATNYDGTTSWNMSNATLFHNVDGDWDANLTIEIAGNLVANESFLVNFTNVVNLSVDGTYQWDVLCREVNASGSQIQTSFKGNNTINVQLAKSVPVTISPINNFLDLDGSDILINCSASPSSGKSINNISLMIDSPGDYGPNQTFSLTNAERAGVSIAHGFLYNPIPNSSIADNVTLTFSCLASQNESIGGLVIITSKSSNNRTILVEYPADPTLGDPIDNNWSMDRRVRINYTISSAHGSNIAPFTSRLWTNETGNWLPATGARTANNNTRVVQFYTFQEQSAILWGIQFSDRNNDQVFNFSVNRTINIDSINPTISIATANNTIQSNTTITIKFTPTDVNLDTVELHANFSGGFDVNYTNNTAVSGEEITFTRLGNISNGVYIYNITVNDSSGREVVSGFNVLIIDTIFPTISAVTNVSVVTACDQSNITFDVSETANFTMQFDTDIDVSDGTTISEPTNGTSHGAVLDFNFRGEIIHYFNITVEDLAGNKNTTTGQTTFQTPARVCSGWSQYAIYDASINLSDIQNQSSADLVYVWNNTVQDWVFFAAGLSANGGVRTGRLTNFPVVHLFENVNATWFRNVTVVDVYSHNVTTVSNWLSVPHDVTFGNLTESFMNGSVQFPSLISNFSSEIANGTTFGPINLTAFAGYNNSAQDYVSHLFNFTFSNSTLLEPCPNRASVDTCMEAFWVASGFNVSWNGTQIYSNWSLS